MKQEGTTKGRNHRCGDDPYVGGVPTEPGEQVWRQGAHGPEKLRSPKQLPGDEELLVVPAHLGAPPREWFGDATTRPDGVWSGTSGPTSMLRSGVDMDQRTATLARHPHLARRFATAPLVRTRPRIDPLDGGEDSRTVLHIAAEVNALGGRALVVGGSVRDAVYAAQRGRRVVSKDLDVEVFGVPVDRLEGVLASMGASAEQHGRRFKAFTLSGIDVTLPRRETKTGRGHTGFDVEEDPDLPPERAVLRRDFTINALMFDPLTGEVIDHVGGVEDLRRGVLRHVSDAFGEDPLRVLRAAQFVARFQLDVDVGTAAVCRQLRDEADTLAGERVYEEFHKLMSKGETPGDGLTFLHEVGWAELWPTVARAAEGGAASSLNAWARSRSRDDALVHGMAVLGCHTDPDPQRAGATAAALVQSWADRPKEAKRISTLVTHHRTVGDVARGGVRDADVMALAEACDGVAAVCEVAGAVGRRQDAQLVLDAAARLGVTDVKAPALVGGDDLIAAGMRPGRQIGEVLKEVRRAQLERRVTGRDDALALALNLAADAAAGPR